MPVGPAQSYLESDLVTRVIFVSLVEDEVEDAPVSFPVKVDVPVAVGVG